MNGVGQTSRLLGLTLAVLVAAAAVAGCASSGARSSVAPGTRIPAPSGVSVRVPPESDWIIMVLSTYQVALARGASGESYVAAVTLHELPEIASEEQFLAYVSAQRRDPETGRFVVLANEEVLDPARGPDCVRYRSTSEDRAAKMEGGRTAVMVADISGYACRHPRRSTVAVTFEYSHRHRPGQPDPAFAEKARRFLDAVAFVDF